MTNQSRDILEMDVGKSARQRYGLSINQINGVIRIHKINKCLILALLENTVFEFFPYTLNRDKYENCTPQNGMSYVQKFSSHIFNKNVILSHSPVGTIPKLLFR